MFIILSDFPHVVASNSSYIFVDISQHETSRLILRLTGEYSFVIVRVILWLKLLIVAMHSGSLFAQCGRVSTPTLTLARYILETSLMDYSYVSCHESMMAAACLLLAMNMNCDGQWVSLHGPVST